MKASGKKKKKSSAVQKHSLTVLGYLSCLFLIYVLYLNLLSSHQATEQDEPGVANAYVGGVDAPVVEMGPPFVAGDDLARGGLRHRYMHAHKGKQGPGEGRS